MPTPPRSNPAQRLAASLGKTGPFANKRQAAYLALARTASELGAELAELFRKHGLTGSTYNTLRVLRGHQPDGLPSQDIGPQLLDRRADVTRLVNRLCQASLAERARDPQDGRVIRVRITTKGKRLLQKLDSPVIEAHERQFQGLSEAELDRLLRLLEKAQPEEAV